MVHDVFMCYAHEDRDAVVQPLARALQARGLSVWWNAQELRLGDSVRRAIERGLSASTFGVVVLSPCFVSKEWPQRELDALLERESTDRNKVVLPVWHNLEHAAVRNHFPLLSAKLGVSTNKGIDYVADAIYEAVAPERRQSALGTPSGTLVVPHAISGRAFPTFSLGASYSLSIDYPAIGELRYPRQGVRNGEIDTTESVLWASPYGPPFVRRLESVGPAHGVQRGMLVDQLAKPTTARATLLFPSNDGPVPVVLKGQITEATQYGVSFENWNRANDANAIREWRLIPHEESRSGLQASVAGSRSSTNTPFVRVDFYRYVVPLLWQYVGSSATSIVDDFASGKVYSYIAPTVFANGSDTWVAEPPPHAGDRFVAVGVTVAGDGIVTLPTTV